MYLYIIDLFSLCRGEHWVFFISLFFLHKTTEGYFILGCWEIKEWRKKRRRTPRYRQKTGDDEPIVQSSDGWAIWSNSPHPVEWWNPEHRVSLWRIHTFETLCRMRKSRRFITWMNQLSAQSWIAELINLLISLLLSTGELCWPRR